MAGKYRASQGGRGGGGGGGLITGILRYSIYTSAHHCGLLINRRGLAKVSMTRKNRCEGGSDGGKI